MPVRNLPAAADAAGVKLNGLRRRLSGLATRGRCAQLAAAAAQADEPSAGVVHRATPPWARPLATFSTSEDETTDEAPEYGDGSVAACRVLASINDPHTRATAVRRVSCPAVLLRSFTFDDDDPYVRLYAATELTHSPRLADQRIATVTFESVAALDSTTHEMLKVSLAECCPCPPHVLVSLTNDASRRVREAAADRTGAACVDRHRGSR